MKFTFGIVTTDPLSLQMDELLRTIEGQNIPDDRYEVIIVGGNQAYKEGLVTIIPFDETVKKGWITRKKNIITEKAKFDCVVYMHDYVGLGAGWYDGFCKFGYNFSVCMTPIKMVNGQRFRDWTLWPDDLYDVLGPWNSHYLLPYDERTLSNHMYISGAYWIAKKTVMQQFPLDESLSWGESEDVKWSKEVRKHYTFSLNEFSHAQLMKPKERVFNEIKPDMLETIKRHALRNV